MKLINLQCYIPEDLFLGEGIQYFIDATGKDWYKSLSKFTKKYSIAIENDTGVIRSISEDADRLYPVGLTVVDVDNIPEGCDIFGGWVFDGKKIIPRAYTAEENKLVLIAQANGYINSKQWPGKAAISRLKGEELAQYNLWLDYLDALEAIDTSSAPDINWPVSPEA
ncbi:tail fiber assembly protein [Citrobacter freundii]|nr:tail fiber assembly protein [Citrobacter freundii]